MGTSKKETHIIVEAVLSSTTNVRFGSKLRKLLFPKIKCGLMGVYIARTYFADAI